MTSGIADQERRRVTEVAEEYRRRGYVVTIEPCDDEVPEFLFPYRPDLIAKGPHETVVVEVKAGTRSATNLVSIASAINSRPGWRFELIVLDAFTTHFTSDLVSMQDLERAVSEAERLIEVGLLPAAFVVLWSATEGALRHSVRRRNAEGDRDPRRLIRQSTSLGMITQSERDFLERSLAVRNQFAHGFQPDALDGSLVRQLLRFTRRLLEAGETIDDSFTFEAVSKWVTSSLTTFQRPRLEDAVFERDAVIVHAPDGAQFLITMEEWTDMEPSRRREVLRTKLVRWASEHIPKGPST